MVSALEKYFLLTDTVIGCWVPVSAWQMKGCIRLLKEQPSSRVDGLLNALRFWPTNRDHMTSLHTHSTRTEPSRLSASTSSCFLPLQVHNEAPEWRGHTQTYQEPAAAKLTEPESSNYWCSCSSEIPPASLLLSDSLLTTFLMISLFFFLLYLIKF